MSLRHEIETVVDSCTSNATALKRWADISNRNSFDYANIEIDENGPKVRIIIKCDGDILRDLIIVLYQAGYLD